MTAHWCKSALRAVAALALGAAATAGAQQTVSSADAGFLKKAAQAGLAEVQLAELAQRKALHEEVKQFADRMVADHRKANEDLMGLAASKRVPLPTEVDDKHRKELGRLEKLVGPDFDRAYMKMMVDDHGRVVRDFEHQAKSARDAEVREFAAKTLPVLQGHLSAAKATYDITLAPKRTGERGTGSTKK